MIVRFARIGAVVMVGSVVACSAAQETSATSSDAVSSGSSLVSFDGAGGCLDVKDGSSANGAALQLWQCASGNTNQQWQFVNGTPLGGNGQAIQDGMMAL